MSRGRTRRRIAALVLAAALVGGMAGPAAATVTGPLTAEGAVPSVPPLTSLDLPDGWSLNRDASGQLGLTWASPRPLRPGGARLEISLDDESLGYGVVARDQRSVSVPISAARAAATQTWSGLAVRAAGRRLDVATDVSPLDAAPTRNDPRLGRGAPIDHDPGVRGSFTTTTHTYVLPRVHLAGLPAKVEVRGVVVAPSGISTPRPLVLFLHGRHSTCFRGKRDSGDWPCPDNYRAIPSERGYLQTQKLLASQGYLTVSIAANGINGQDWALADGGAEARSLLIQQHLKLWAGWSASNATHALAPPAVAKAPRADLSRVLLVGHSRGGEGVNRAALDSTTRPKVPWKIRGLVHIGPTAFGQNPAPGVPVVVLLPYCDGDVSDLQGQAYLDAARNYHDSAFRSAVLVLGANHNYFNAEWTPGAAIAPAWDDWYDPKDKVCGTHAPQRLSATRERAVGATYTAAAAALFLRHDESVLPMLDGRGRRAASAGGAAVLASAIGARRSAAVRPSASLGVISTLPTKARLCRTAESSSRRAMCEPDAGWGVTPHFLPVYSVAGEPSRSAIHVSWTSAQGRAELVPTHQRNLSRATRLSLRVAVEAGGPGARFGVRLVDSTGTRVVLPAASVASLPRTSHGFEGKTWAQEVQVGLRTPSVASSGVDLHAITRIELLPRSPRGELWLLDIWGWHDGLSADKPLRLPQVDVAHLTVDEGDRDHLVRLPLTVRGPAHGAGRLWVEIVDPNTSDLPTRMVIDVPAGAKHVYVDVPVAGDDRDDYDTDYVVAVKPVRGLAVGDYAGGVTVLDDDPPPTLTVTPIRTSVLEGRTLSWRLDLSAPSDVGVFLELVAVGPEVGTPPEVSTDDLPRAWLRRHEVVAGPAIPLSEAAPYAYLFFDSDQSVTFKVPTSKDSRAEGDESVTFAIVGAEQVTLPAPVPLLVGTVRDPA